MSAVEGSDHGESLHVKRPGQSAENNLCAAVDGGRCQTGSSFRSGKRESLQRKMKKGTSLPLGCSAARGARRSESGSEKQVSGTGLNRGAALPGSFRSVMASCCAQRKTGSPSGIGRRGWCFNLALRSAGLTGARSVLGHFQNVRCPLLRSRFLGPGIAGGRVAVARYGTGGLGRATPVLRRSPKPFSSLWQAARIPTK